MQTLCKLQAGCVCSLPSAFLGDPRDYAWGADGLDNAITQASQLSVDFVSDQILVVGLMS